MKGFVQILILGLIVAVLVLGEAFYLKQKPKISTKSQSAISQNSTQSVQPSPTISPLEDIANWKTYTSPSNLFSFKYPSTWKEDINEPGEEVVLSVAKTTPSGGGLNGLSVIVRDNPNALAIQDFIKRDTYNMYSLSHFVKNPVSLGIQADWVIDRNSQGAGSQQQEVLISKGTKVVDLGFGSLSYQLTDQILSTFKFTNQNPTALKSNPPCPNGTYSAVNGPLIQGQSPQTICVPNGQAVPQ